MVWVQVWTLVQGSDENPGGFSLHLTLENVGCFVKNYRNGLPLQPPDKYFSPKGVPYQTSVDSETFDKVRSAGKFGCRVDRVLTGNGDWRKDMT